MNAQALSAALDLLEASVAKLRDLQAQAAQETLDQRARALVEAARSTAETPEQRSLVEFTVEIGAALHNNPALPAEQVRIWANEKLAELNRPA